MKYYQMRARKNNMTINMALANHNFMIFILRLDQDQWEVQVVTKNKKSIMNIQTQIREQGHFQKEHGSKINKELNNIGMIWIKEINKRKKTLHERYGMNLMISFNLMKKIHNIQEMILKEKTIKLK
jgi:hypothetical protein